MARLGSLSPIHGYTIHNDYIESGNRSSCTKREPAQFLRNQLKPWPIQYSGHSKLVHDTWKSFFRSKKKHVPDCDINCCKLGNIYWSLVQLCWACPGAPLTSRLLDIWKYWVQSVQLEIRAELTAHISRSRLPRRCSQTYLFISYLPGNQIQIHFDTSIIKLFSSIYGVATSNCRKLRKKLCRSLQ